MQQPDGPCRRSCHSWRIAPPRPRPLARRLRLRSAANTRHTAGVYPWAPPRRSARRGGCRRLGHSCRRAPGTSRRPYARPRRRPPRGQCSAGAGTKGSAARAHHTPADRPRDTRAPRGRHRNPRRRPESIRERAPYQTIGDYARVRYDERLCRAHHAFTCAAMRSHSAVNSASTASISAVNSA